MPFEVTADPAAFAYADATAADAVAALRVGGAAWLALDAGDKTIALATASADIDTLEGNPGFIGERTSIDQELAWPRTGTDYSDDAWPRLLVSATIELAFTYVPAFVAGATIDVLNQNRGDGLLKRKKVDVLEKEWFAPRSVDATSIERFPDVVQRLLWSLLLHTADVAGAWGSAIVSRGS